MCGCGREYGTCSLPGPAVAKKQGDRIPPEMEMVPVPGSGQPVHGGEHLPVQSPAWTPGREVSVAEGVESTAGKKKPNPTR